ISTEPFPLRSPADLSRLLVHRYGDRSILATLHVNIFLINQRTRCLVPSKNLRMHLVENIDRPELLTVAQLSADEISPAAVGVNPIMVDRRRGQRKWQTIIIVPRLRLIGAMSDCLALTPDDLSRSCI